MEYLKGDDTSIREIGEDVAEWGGKKLKAIVREFHGENLEDRSRFQDRYDSLSLAVHWDPSSVISIGGHAKGSNAFLVGVEALVDSLLAFCGLFECLGQEHHGRIIRAYGKAADHFAQDGAMESGRKG